MTINEIQDDIVAEFSEVDDWMDRYGMIIDLGNSLPPIDEQYRDPAHLIEGCQSRVWVNAELTPEDVCTIRPTPTLSSSRASYRFLSRSLTIRPRRYNQR